MITSFRDKDTQQVWRREHVPRLGADIQRRTRKRSLCCTATSSLRSASPSRNSPARSAYRARVSATSFAVCDPSPADTGLRLSRYFGMSDGFWINLQADYDMQVALDQYADELARVRPRA